MSKFIKAQDAELAKKQLLAFKRILQTLKASKAQVIETILSTDGFQQELMMNTLNNIDILMRQLRSELTERYQIIVKEGTEIGSSHQIALIKELMGARIGKEVLTALVGPVEVSVLTNLEVNVDTYLARFTAGLREKVKNTVQQSFIHGRSESETMIMINQQYGSEQASTQRAVHQIYQTAYNAANHDVLVELEKSVPDLAKELYAELDRKTTTLCRSMHGQIKPVQEPFIDPASGSEFLFPPIVFGNADLTPPFHFCRTRSIPHLKD